MRTSHPLVGAGDHDRLQSLILLIFCLRLRELLRQEWVEKQQMVKNETINIAFSYWDGSGHRKDTKMKKGNSIGQFLNKALDILRSVRKLTNFNTN